MSENRTQKIEIRVSPSEKAKLVTAAGGARKTGGWMRDLALAAADSSGPYASVPEAGLSDTSVVASVSEAPAPPRAVAGEDCPRWMHHRTGVYCGTCKKVR